MNSISNQILRVWYRPLMRLWLKPLLINLDLTILSRPFLLGFDRSLDINSPMTRFWNYLGSLLAVESTFPGKIVVFGIRNSFLGKDWWSGVGALSNEILIWLILIKHLNLHLWQAEHCTLYTAQHTVHSKLHTQHSQKLPELHQNSVNCTIQAKRTHF